MLVPLLSGVLAAAPYEPIGRLEADLGWASPLPYELPVPLEEPAPAWADIPVARSLHPVAFHYGHRFQALLTSTMGGARASSVFGPVVAQADVHWRLVEATGRGLPLESISADAWRDAAVAGSLLAGENLFDETLQRAPVLYGVYVVGDTLLSPSVDLRRREKDRVEVAHRGGGSARRRLEREEEELAEPRRERRTQPVVGVGVDWDVREDDDGSAPIVQYTAWMNLKEVGLSSVRVEVAPTNLSWVVSGREQIRPRLYLIGSARSADEAPDPARLSGGLMWVLPWRGSWNVRFERIVSLTEGDERWMLTVRCENRTRVPAPPAPPLGDRGLDGPSLPWVPDRGPNRVEPW